MADNYTNVSITAYNANPPPDDATQVTANALGWSKHKEKLGDPLKTAIEAIDTNVDAAITALEAFLPPGVIMPYAGSAAPNTNWVLCDGTSYNSVTDTSFANLFSVIGVNYGGTGASAFNVPDARGLFIRGTDNGAGNDPDAASRTDRGDGTGGDVVGSKQADDFESHSHGSTNLTFTDGETASASVSTDAGTTSLAGLESGQIRNTNVGSQLSITGDIGGTTDNAPTSGGNETRPTNIGLNFLIKK